MTATKWGGSASRNARSLVQHLVDAGAPCYRCRKPILPGQTWHADHIIPREHGGTDDVSNLHPSHARCNESAGGQSGAALTNARRKAKGEPNQQTRGSQIASSRVSADSFEGGQAAHGYDRADFLSNLQLPDVLPPVTAVPTILSPTPDDVDLAEAELGAKWLSLPLTPQGLQVARVLQAVQPSGKPVYRTVVVEMARRSAKTTSILETLLGRCLTRPGYKVASTAQTGTKARAKLLEVQQALRSAGFETQELGKCLAGMGDTRIRFANESLWQSLPPDPSSFRSEAYDAILVDEAGELDPEKGDALLAGLLPTMDTRPNAQLIVAGTPGETRAGMLWTRLEHLRAGRVRVGGVVYEAADSERFIDAETGEVDWSLLLRLHPGISAGLTDVETVVGNLEDFGLDKWSREYLCAWPRHAGVRALNAEAWERCLVERPPARPANAAVAWDVDPGGSFAALVAAWRDDKGRACLDVLRSGSGTDWLPDAAQTAQAEHRGTVTYDAIGSNIDTADVMGRSPYRVRLAPIVFRDQVGAASRIDKEITRRNVEHYGQPALTEAVEGATWRPAGKEGRLFARAASASSVAALVAAAEALWTYDQRTGKGGTGRRVRTAAEIMEERRLQAAGK